MGSISVSDLIGNINIGTSISNTININDKIDISSISAGLGQLILDNSIIHFDDLSIKFNDFDWSKINIDSTSIKPLDLGDIKKINITDEKTHTLSLELPKIENIPINDIYTFNDKFNTALFDISNIITGSISNSFDLSTYTNLKSLINPLIDDTNTIIGIISTKTSEWIDEHLKTSIGLGITITSQVARISDNIIEILKKLNLTNTNFRLGNTINTALSTARNVIFGDQSMISLDSQKNSWYNLAKNGLTDYVGTVINITNVFNDKNSTWINKTNAVVNSVKSIFNTALKIYMKLESIVQAIDYRNFGSDPKNFNDKTIYKVLMNRTRLSNMYNTFNTNSNWYIEIVPYNRFTNITNGYNINNDTISVDESNIELPPSLYNAYNITNSDERYKLPIESYQIINDSTNVLSYDMYPFDSTKIFTNSILQKAESIVLNLYDYFPDQNRKSALDYWKSEYLKFINSKDTNESVISRFYQDCCYLIVLYRYNGRYNKSNYIYSIEKFIGLPYGIRSNRSGSSSNDGVIIDQLNFYVVGKLKNKNIKIKDKTGKESDVESWI